MNNKNTFTVGQKFYFVPDTTVSGRRTPTWVTVTQVGRKWITTDQGMRFDPLTLQVDGGQYSSPGRMYVNREEHEARVLVHTSWRHLVHDMQTRRAPNTVSAEDIERARKLLGL